MVDTIPLLPSEIAIVAALAGGNLSQTAACFGMHHRSLDHTLARIIKRIDQAGGDSLPLIATMHQRKRRQRPFTDLSGKNLTDAKKYISGNEIVKGGQ